jgi:MFS family permease
MMTSERVSQPRSWYHGWNIVAVCLLAQVVANGLTYNTFSLFLRGWAADLHTPLSSLQLPIFAMVLVCSLLSPLAGSMADRYPARWLIACGLLGMALFQCLLSFATAGWQFLALYGLLASPALTFSTAVIANPLISRWFVRRRGLALGISGIGMAGIILPPLIAELLPPLGWRTIWRLGAAVIAFVAVPIVLLLIRDRPGEPEGAYYLSGADHAASLDPHAAGGSGLMWRDVLGRRTFWLVVAIYLPFLALYGACGQNLAPFVASRGQTPQFAATLLSVLSATHVAATLALGLIADRFGSRYALVGLALVVAGGGTLMALGGSSASIVIACGLIGMGGAVYPPITISLANEFGANSVGKAFGLASFFLPIMAVAPFIVARTQEASGSYTPGFAGLTLIVLLVSGGLSFLLPRGRSGAAAIDPNPDEAMPQAI